jgi:hypothetical protein
MSPDIKHKILKAYLGGVPLSQMIPLYVDRNALDLDPPEVIYRIFQFDYLAADLANGQLTHVKADPKIWKDPHENPLLRQSFKGDNVGERVSLSGLVDKFFALSWTLDPDESDYSWQIFSHGVPSVRIRTTVGKLLAGIMSPHDRFYMLHHYIGRVQYRSLNDIQTWLANSHFADFLDSQGFGLALSAMTLRSKYSSEKEVRLLYSYAPQDDNPWVARNVSATAKTCAIPFDWKGVIDEVVLAPHLPSADVKRIKEFFASQHALYPISPSAVV